MTVSTTIAPRRVTVPSARVLVGGAYTVFVLGLIGVHAGHILLTDVDPHQNDGPVESMLGVGIAGTAALVLSLVIGLGLAGTPERAKVGAVVLGGLAVLSIVVFWSGAPGVLGAAAAWQAGMTKGRTPLGGAARAFGILGLFLVVLTLVSTVFTGFYVGR